MDPLIARFDGVDDDDLVLCLSRGVAYQRDMSQRVSYDATYFDKCAGYEDQEIALRINAGRIALVGRHAGAGDVLDVGIGSGEFVKKRPRTFGTDINPRAVEWLIENGVYGGESFTTFNAFTFWDVIEHVDNPQLYFQGMAPGAWLFASLPVFADLTRIRQSRHYRPGEHLYYWTEAGFVDWMALHRFELVERCDFETLAGRDSILSFAFRRTLPGYSETLAQYQKLHGGFYGASAWLYLDDIAPVVVAMNPASVLDYGCGRSDLVAHFWNDGRRRIAKYDPAIGAYEQMPEGDFDLVICCDVMEHILMADVDKVLAEIRAKSPNALFTISLRPARSRLPDGRNAHVTLLTASEWQHWIASVFGVAERVPTRWDHILMLKTFA